MYVMNFLKENIHSKEIVYTSLEIVSYLERTEKIKNNEYFSIYECSSNIDTSKYNIYQAIHTLLDLNVLKKCEFAVCPVCDTENQIHNMNRTKCSFCRSTFIPDDINERFIFIYD